MKFQKLLVYIFVIISVYGFPLRAQEQRNTLRILDVNVWSGLDYIGSVKMGEYESKEIREKRYQALIEQIQELNPDVIGIHEANKLPRYAKRIARDLNYKAFYHIGVAGIHIGRLGLPMNLREGDVILVKKEFQPKWLGRKQLSGGYVGKYFTFHFEDATQVIGVQILINEIPANIYTTHWHAELLPSKEVVGLADNLLINGHTIQTEYDSLFNIINSGIEWRKAESDKTIEFIESISITNLNILMGDFNSTNESEEIKHLEDYGFIDTYKYLYPDSAGYTWEPQSNLNQQIHYLQSDSIKVENLIDRANHLDKQLPKRIDCIFVGDKELIRSQKVKIIDSKVVLKKIINGVQASDHYGIFTEIVISE